ncbi:esterase [Lactococcus hodotermopsidis]|uniref:Esterase n=1 Tax=Pseudolactococcus hodotermopsidis TaxID=2709157 RepID=A0A6A0B8W8_9LACT|nr:GDSL-type esterase/lipase family protein [Lactococcus hodotermopsidis]GFH41859.1 esterase [Lactococcus hodotermopsidis]
MKIAIFGDSISTKVEMKTLTEKFLEQMGVPGEVVLFAVAGEDTSVAKKRLVQVVPANADYNFIFFGANDAAIHHDVSPEQFTENLIKFATALGVEKTTFLTTPYVNEEAIAETQLMVGRSNANVSQYVAAAKKASEQTGAQILDLNHAMTVYPGSDEFVGADGLHFTRVGYELVTSLIAVNVRTREMEKSHD